MPWSGSPQFLQLAMISGDTLAGAHTTAGDNLPRPPEYLQLNSGPSDKKYFYGTEC